MSLKELRLKRGLTQRELADKIGVPYGRIADTERGARPIENMSLGMAIKIGDALHVSNLRKLLDDSSSEDSIESEKDNTSA